MAVDDDTFILSLIPAETDDAVAVVLEGRCSLKTEGAATLLGSKEDLTAGTVALALGTILGSLDLEFNIRVDKKINNYIILKKKFSRQI